MTTRRLFPFLPGIVSLLSTLLSGLVLFNSGNIGNLASFIINIGLDPQRAQLIAALMMATGAAFIGGISGRQKVGAMLGAGSIFGLSYLATFIQLQLQPFRDPGGMLEPLNSGALVYTSCMLLALALLSAFIGAVVGKALAEVLLDPPYRFLYLLWQHYTPLYARQTMPLSKKEIAGFSPRGARTRREVLGSWFGILAMLALILLASGSSDLFVFSPDIGLHTPPTPPTLHGGARPVHSTIVHDEVVSTALQGQKKSFLVYLPPSYTSPAGRAKRYPTLYLLHGSPGSERDWFSAGKANQSADTLIALGRISELILILPNGNGRPGTTSEWGNSFDRRQNIETYVAADLVNYVDHKYRTIADTAHRGIAGLSMGGFGAMNIAVHHPDIFGVVISLGGYYRAEGSIWGGNAAYMRENSPLVMLPTNKRAWHLRIYLGAATRDQPYYNDTKEFVQELHTLHIPYRLDVQNGFHAWNVWQTQLYNAFLWLRW